MPTRIVLLLAIIYASMQDSILNGVIVTERAINTVTTYTWQITFDSATNRNSLNLTFPTSCTLYPNTTATILATSTTLTVAF